MTTEDTELAGCASCGEIAILNGEKLCGDCEMYFDVTSRRATEIIQNNLDVPLICQVCRNKTPLANINRSDTGWVYCDECRRRHRLA